MQEALLNEDVTLSQGWYNSSEELADAGTVTVDVYREDGTELETNAATTGTGAAVRGYVIDSEHTTQQDVLKVVWTATSGGTKTTYVELFEQFFVDLDEIRLEPNIDTSNYTTARLIRARRWFTDLSQNYCKKSFIPRYTRELISGRRVSQFQLSHTYIRELLKVTRDGTVQVATSWVPYPNGKVITPNTYLTAGYNNYSISYTHGLDYPDEELKLAALDAIRDWLVSDRAGLSARTLSQTNAYMGTTKYSHAGKDRPTGIPHVDYVLNERRKKLMILG